jgi:hypothetical protein
MMAWLIFLSSDVKINRSWRRFALNYADVESTNCSSPATIRISQITDFTLEIEDNAVQNPNIHRRKSYEWRARTSQPVFYQTFIGEKLLDFFVVKSVYFA